MTEKITSRERLQAALALQEPDRVPIVFRGLAPMRHRWKDAVERAEVLLSLGTDDIIGMSTAVRPPIVHHKDVKTRVWKESAVPYPVLHKEWRTPAGTLHASVQVTEDWQVSDVLLIKSGPGTLPLPPPALALSSPLPSGQSNGIILSWQPLSPS